MVNASYAALTEGEVYVPGLPSEYVAQKYGIPLEQIAKLGSAENPHGPSPKALAAVIEAAGRIDRGNGASWRISFVLLRKCVFSRFR